MPDQDQQKPSYYLSVTRGQLRRIEKDNMQIHPLHGHLCLYGDPITFLWTMHPKSFAEAFYPNDICDMIFDFRHVGTDTRELFRVEIKPDTRFKFSKFSESVKKFKVRKEFCDYLTGNCNPLASLLTTQDVIQREDIISISTALIMPDHVCSMEKIFTQTTQNIDHGLDINIRKLYSAQFNQMDSYYTPDLGGMQLNFRGIVQSFGLHNDQKTLLLCHVYDYKTFRFYRNHVWLSPDDNPILRHENFMQGQLVYFTATVRNYPDNPQKYGFLNMAITSIEFSPEIAKLHNIGMACYKFLHASKNAGQLAVDRQYKVVEYKQDFTTIQRKEKERRRKERKKLKRK